MWEEESIGSSYVSARDGQESVRESVVDTDEEAELYAYIHHEQTLVDQSQILDRPGNAKKPLPSSNNPPSGPTASFLALLDTQKPQVADLKESNQVHPKPPVPTSVYGNRIYEVVRGKIKSWSKPEASILNWLGDVPEKNITKSQLSREGHPGQGDSQSCTDSKKVPPTKPGVKLNVTYQVAESTVNISPFNNCTKLESSAVNWMRDISYNGTKSPKTPNLNSPKDTQGGSEANKTAKTKAVRQTILKGSSSDTAHEETDKNNSIKGCSVPPPILQPKQPNSASDTSKKNLHPPTKVDSNNRAASSPLNKQNQQSKIPPFITSPKVMRGSVASWQVASFSMDNQPNDKTNKKQKKGQKVAFVTPLTDVGQRNSSTKCDVELNRSKSNLSVTISTNETDEACDSKYNYSGKKAARHTSPQRVVEYSNTCNARLGKAQQSNSEKPYSTQNKNVLRKNGEKLVVAYSDCPKEVIGDNLVPAESDSVKEVRPIDTVSISSDASCSVLPDSELSSDLDANQGLDLPISIAIHIGDANRTVVVRNTSSESTIQEPKIKKRKLKKESKKRRSSKVNHKRGCVVGLAKDSNLSFEEQMRKFYDSENSDAESDNIQRHMSGDWSVLDVDRQANIKASNRYFVGFDQKQKLFCGNCRQRGHVMRTCPEPRRIPHCILCGEPYHKAEVCFEMTCSRCLRRGHSTDSCQVSSKYLDPPCNLCWMPGHMEDQCPDYWRRYYLTTKVGPIVQGTTMDVKEPSCYNCASKFHWGYECRKPRMCPDIYPNYPFIVSFETPQQPRSKNHNSNRLTAGHDGARIEKEIYKLVSASNYAWQQESSELRHTYKRFKTAQKLTVEERRKIKQEAKLKKRVENAQRKLDWKVQKRHSGTNNNQKWEPDARNIQNLRNFTAANQHRAQAKAHPNLPKKHSVANYMNQCWQFRNRKQGSDSSFFQETMVNKNTRGRKRAQDHELNFVAKRRKGANEICGTQKRNRNRKRKKK